MRPGKFRHASGLCPQNSLGWEFAWHSVRNAISSWLIGQAGRTFCVTCPRCILFSQLESSGRVRSMVSGFGAPTLANRFALCLDFGHYLPSPSDLW
jgi:hypothetical protein